MPPFGSNTDLPTVARSVTLLEAQETFEVLLDELTGGGGPIQIDGTASSAVLLSERDWRSLTETLYLQSIPGMAPSIEEGMATPVLQCSETLEE